MDRGCNPSVMLALYLSLLFTLHCYWTIGDKLQINPLAPAEPASLWIYPLQVCTVYPRRWVNVFTQRGGDSPGTISSPRRNTRCTLQFGCLYRRPVIIHLTIMRGNEKRREKQSDQGAGGTLYPGERKQLEINWNGPPLQCPICAPPSFPFQASVRKRWDVHCVEAVSSVLWVQGYWAGNYVIPTCRFVVQTLYTLSSPCLHFYCRLMTNMVPALSRSLFPCGDGEIRAPFPRGQIFPRAPNTCWT